MAFYGDYHTHTKYSHGKGTIEDNILAAISLGLKELAITDHGFRHGAYHVRRSHWPIMKAEMARLRKKYPMIKLYLGLETNLIHIDGTIDIEDRDDLDLLVCGYHKYVFSEKFGQYFKFWLPNFVLDLFDKTSKKQRIRNTAAYVNAIEKNEIDIISHPLRGLGADIKEIAKAAAAYGTYLELNGKCVDMNKEDIDAALSEGVQFIINSDAHHPRKIGNFTVPLAAVEKYDIPHESIANLDKQPNFRSVKKLSK